MNDTLPSQNLRLLRKLLGKRIISVKRQLFKSDMDLPDYEQNADGPVEFTISDNLAIHFVADTEALSVGVASGVMPLYGDSYELADVSNNSFWGERVGQETTQITILRSTDWSKDYPCEFGVEILFANGKKALIEYKDEEDYPDMIKVTGSYAGRPCVIQQVD